MKPHKASKRQAAIDLYAKLQNFAWVARCLGVGRQTVRRWVVPGEAARHDKVIRQYEKTVREYRDRLPAPLTQPEQGRCAMDSVVDIEHRIAAHRQRILQGGECAAPSRREVMRGLD